MRRHIGVERYSKVVYQLLSHCVQDVWMTCAIKELPSFEGGIGFEVYDANAPELSMNPRDAESKGLSNIENCVDEAQ
jgi:hypothetical protein